MSAAPSTLILAYARWIDGDHDTSVCRIVADVFERRSGIVEALRRDGVDVELSRLPVADYDVGNGVLVERKTVADLHLSIERGRLWRQLGMLRDACRLPYLFVEGPDLRSGPIPPRAIRGACLAAIGQGIAVVQTRDSCDSAIWRTLLAARASGVRRQRDRPAYAQRLSPPATQVREAMLAAVPGISVATARSLLAQFGSVASIVGAGPDAWLAVPGMGQKRVQALLSAVS